MPFIILNAELNTIPIFELINNINNNIDTNPVSDLTSKCKLI